MLMQCFMKYRRFFSILDRCCEVMKNEVFNNHLHEDNGIVCRVLQQLEMLNIFKYVDAISIA